MLPLDPHATLETLSHSTLVGVVRSRDPRHAEALFNGLLEGGLRAIEVTATTPGCFDLLRDAHERARRSGIVLGVGTVRTSAELNAAAESGAQFIVSPHTNVGLVAEAKAKGLVVIPGALTPTEIVAARTAGAHFVKVFPVSAMGGPTYVKLLSGPLPDVPLWVSGDVQLDEIPAYLAAGAKLIGLTSALDPGALTENPLAEARSRAGAALEALAGAQKPAPLLNLVVGGQTHGIGLKEIRRLPGSEHIRLESMVPGRRGHGIRLGVLLRAAGLPETATLRITSTDGFSREMSAQQIYEDGILHWATDGRPLTPGEGGPLRLYLVQGDDQCDNVKGLSEIAVIP